MVNVKDSCFFQLIMFLFPGEAIWGACQGTTAMALNTDLLEMEEASTMYLRWDDVK